MSGATMGGGLVAPTRDTAMAVRLGRRRKRGDLVARALAWAATGLALGMLAWILATLIWLGARGLTFNTLITVTKAPGSQGGLANAIVGSLVQTALGTAVGTPIGLMVGTYLAEYAGRSALGNAVRFVSDILLSAPSILIGLFIYTVLVAPFGGFSGFAGAGGATLENHRAGVLPRRRGRAADRHSAGRGPYRRGDGAAAVHLARQLRLFGGGLGHGQRAGDDLSIRCQRLR